MGGFFKEKSMNKLQKIKEVIQKRLEKTKESRSPDHYSHIKQSEIITLEYVLDVIKIYENEKEE